MQYATPLECAEGLSVAAWRNVCVSVFRARTTAAHMSRIERLTAAAAPQCPSGQFAMIVLEPAAFAAAPEAGMREVLDRMLALHPPRAVAVVIEGGGLRVTLIRGLLGGILKVARPKQPVRSFESGTAAARWLAAEVVAVEAEVSAAQAEDGIVAALKAARAAFH